MKTSIFLMLFLSLCITTTAEIKTWENVYCAVSNGQNFNNLTAVDFTIGPNGNIYVVGYGSYFHDSISDKDLIILKIDSLGNLISEKIITHDSNSVDVPIAIRYNIINGLLYIVSNSLINDSLNYSFVYGLNDSLEQVFLDSITILNCKGITSSKMEVDLNGNTIISGVYSEIGNGINIFISKLTVNYTQTVTTYNNANSVADENVVKIAFDSNSNIFILGGQTDSVKGKEWLLLKYNNDLTFIKKINFNYKTNLSVDDIASDFIIGANNDIYITGKSGYSTSHLKTKLLTVKYNAAFKKIWVNVALAGYANSRQICFTDSNVFISCDKFKLLVLSPETGIMKKEISALGVAINDFKLNTNNDIIAVGKADTVYKKSSTHQGYLTRWNTAGNIAYEKMLPANFVSKVGYESEYLKVIPIQDGFYILARRFNSSVLSGYCMKVQRFTYDTPLRNFSETQDLANSLKVMPNPAIESATINFINAQNENVEVAIFNLMGQKIKTLKSGFLNTGDYALVWDLKEDNGHEVNNGVYIVQLLSPNGINTQKVLVNRK